MSEVQIESLEDRRAFYVNALAEADSEEEAAEIQGYIDGIDAQLGADAIEAEAESEQEQEAEAEALAAQLEADADAAAAEAAASAEAEASATDEGFAV